MWSRGLRYRDVGPCPLEPDVRRVPLRSGGTERRGSAGVRRPTCLPAPGRTPGVLPERQVRRQGTVERRHVLIGVRRTVRWMKRRSTPLHRDMVAYLQDKTLFVLDAWAGADPAYRLPIRIVNEFAWHNLFARNMFLPENDPASGRARAEFTVSTRRTSRPTRLARHRDRRSSSSCTSARSSS